MVGDARARRSRSGVESMSRAPWVMAKAADGRSPPATGRWPTRPSAGASVNPGWRRSVHADSHGQHRRERRRALRRSRARSRTRSRCARQQRGGGRAAGASRTSSCAVGERCAPTRARGRDASLEELAKLRPAFRDGGTRDRRQLQHAQRRCRGAGRSRARRVRRRARRRLLATVVGIGGGRRRAARHGHRAGAGDRKALRAAGLAARRHRPRRAQRGVRRAGPRRAPRARTSTRGRASTSTAARSRSATRSAPPARAWSSRCARAPAPRRPRTALATMCIGVGQGIAMVLERSP